MPQYTLPSADLPDATGPRLSTVNIAYGFTQIHPSKDSVYLILDTAIIRSTPTNHSTSVEGRTGDS